MYDKAAVLHQKGKFTAVLPVTWMFFFKTSARFCACVCVYMRVCIPQQSPAKPQQPALFPAGFVWRQGPCRCKTAPSVAICKWNLKKKQKKLLSQGTLTQNSRFNPHSGCTCSLICSSHSSLHRRLPAVADVWLQSDGFLKSSNENQRRSFLQLQCQLVVWNVAVGILIDIFSNCVDAVGRNVCLWWILSH